MSMRADEGDILANRLNLGLAKNQKLLASWMGTEPDAQPKNDDPKIEEENNELKQDFFGHDRYVLYGENVDHSLNYIGLALVVYYPKRSRMEASLGGPSHQMTNS